MSQAKQTAEFKPVAITFRNAEVVSGLSRSTLYNHIEAGRLISVKVGGRRLILVASLNEMLAPPDPPPAPRRFDPMLGKRPMGLQRKIRTSDPEEILASE